MCFSLPNLDVYYMLCAFVGGKVSQMRKAATRRRRTGTGLGIMPYVYDLVRCPEEMRNTDMVSFVKNNQSMYVLYARMMEFPNLKLLVNTILFIYSKNVNKFVCSMFMALVASLASMTQLMLISLAPISQSG